MRLTLFGRRLLSIQALAVCAVVFSSDLPAFAQEAASQPDIVVTGSPVLEQAAAFVTEVAEAPAAEDQLARWNSRICVGAVGLEQRPAQTLVDRISTRAQAVGLRPGQTGCRPNVVVIYAPDSDTLTREIVDRRRDLLGYYNDEGVVTAGREALEAFANTSRAVRWWHVAQTTDSDGGAIGNSDTADGRGNAVGDNSVDGGGRVVAAGGGPSNSTQAVADASMGTGSFQGLEGVRSSGSRMRRSTRQDINYVLIIVDAPRVGGVLPSAWMDYVAFVALAQINPDAAPSTTESVLNIFSAPDTAPEAMTTWDEAYLDALYRATRTATSSRRQRAEMVQSIADRVGAPR